MKRLVSIFLCAIFALCLSSCTYNPPEGWTHNHHSYEEGLDFAKDIDPNATVSEEFSDILDEYDWEYREWDAIIYGVDCHVASVSDWVFNDGFLAGEFPQFYYRIDTDYDYIMLQSILDENYSDWNCREGVHSKYHSNTNSIYAELTISDYCMLTDDELEEVWKTVCKINEEYKKYSIERNVAFSIPSPDEFFNHHGEQESFVKVDSYTYISEFTEEAKKEFIDEYKENWSLLESGLPVYD